MDVFAADDYINYWETNMFLQSQELDSTSYFDDALSSYYDSSSPDGAHQPPPSSPAASKNIASERSRRKKLNERLYALRSVVPNITKMDKASIIKDAIEHIQSLHDEEKRLHSEISELQELSLMRRSSSSSSDDHHHHHHHQDFDPSGTFHSRSKRVKLLHNGYGSSSGLRLITSPIEVTELRVTCVGEKTVVVSLTCEKRRDTMVKLCEVFESLKLKVITANITSVSGKLMKTVFIEADAEEKEMLRFKIQAALNASNNCPDEYLI